MASQLAMSLRGNAQRVLSEITREELFDYERLKCSLTQRFCPPERETAFRCEFRNRRRKRDETVAEYGYALKRIATRAFPDMPLTVRESLIVEQYISGLSDPELKRFVQFSHPQTLDKAISLALEFEAFEGSQLHHRKPKAEEYSTVCSAVHVDEKVNNTGLQADMFSKLLEGMQEVQKSMQTMLRKQFESRSRNHNSQHTSNVAKKPVQCFYCKQEGHMKKNCPALNNNENGPSKSQIEHKKENTEVKPDGLK